jgi:hypothetical protein
MYLTRADMKLEQKFNTSMGSRSSPESIKETFTLQLAQVATQGILMQ